MDSKQSSDLSKARESLMRLTMRFRSVEYRTTTANYSLKLINEIIYDDHTKLVSNFKSFLLLEDETDFLEKFHYGQQNIVKLRKILSFYEASAFVFPSYIKLSHQRYFHKNISRKNAILNRAKPAKKKDYDVILTASKLKEIKDNSSDTAELECSIENLANLIDSVLLAKDRETPLLVNFGKLGNLLNGQTHYTRNKQNNSPVKVKIKMLSSTPVSGLLNVPAKSVLRLKSNAASPFFSTSRFDGPFKIKNDSTKTRNKEKKDKPDELLNSAGESNVKFRTDRKFSTTRLKHTSEDFRWKLAKNTNMNKKGYFPKEVQILSTLLKKKQASKK